MISLVDSTEMIRRGGNVGDSGSFEVKGIPYGEYKIRIVRMPSNLDVEVVDERIPDKYKNVGTSGLTASITSEEPVTLNIDMVN
ncbi:hypothetical protein OAG71_03765 [bacterium]|nr:hypothetical protein [bacterium]